LCLGRYLGKIYYIMHTEILIVAGVVLAGAGAVAGYKALNSKAKQKISKENLEILKKEIEQGIIYEDEFVDTYYNLIRNEGYMHAFGGHEKQANDLLFKMIEESKAHKASLQNIEKQLGL
jgi:hypothetical protein